MPHHDGTRRSRAARYATAVALLLVQGCTSDDARVIVRVMNGSGRAVIASPVDPRALPAWRTPGAARATVSRSIARYYAAVDSADSLDAAFRSARDSLNREARSLTGGDRRTIEYAKRYDAHMARVAVATRTREARDRARRRAATLHTQLGADAPDPAQRHAEPGARLRVGLDSAARASGKAIVRAELRDDRAILELSPGTWWLAVEGEDGLFRDVRRHDVRAQAGDTVRLGS
jgi:hypothetical protein